MATGRKPENSLPKPIPSLPLNQHTIHNRHLKHLNPQANHPRRPAVAPAGQTRYRRRAIVASGNDPLNLVLTPLTTENPGSRSTASFAAPPSTGGCRQNHAPKSTGTEFDAHSEGRWTSKNGIIMGDGDDYDSDQDIYSGNSQPTSPVASVKTTGISAALSRKRVASEDSAQGRKISLEEHAIRCKRQKFLHSYSAPPSNPAVCPGIHKKIWAEIFSLLPPEHLSQVRRTCKTFDKYLDDQNIWRRSRKLYLPDHPRPVFGLTEWEMLCLMWGNGCMLCEKGTKRDKGSRAVSSKGSSMVYWPFRVRCCKECLEENSTKEFAILSSASIPKALLPALPFGIVDVRNNWISNPPHYQPNIGLTKIFWNSDIKDILQRYEHAKEMDAEEEWLKGLESEGLAHKLDVLRIERFEKTRPQLSGEGGGYTVDSGAPKHHYSSTSHNLGDTSAGCQEIKQQHSVSRPSLQKGTHNAAPITKMAQSGKGLGQPCKADICMADRNGLPQNSHSVPDLPAFQTAIKAAIPPDDTSWLNLNHKLFEQRYAAEKTLDNLRNEDIAKVQRFHEQRKAQDELEKDAKEKLEKEWNDVQAPVREKLVSYADEVIKSYRGVLRDTAPKFAVDVLLHCRSRFYEENPYSSDDPHHVKPLCGFSQEGRATLERPTARRLTLDNMKFVYDTKIKPLTERFRKELFFCNGCERNSKYYGFEAVIQHYSAKHTPFLGAGQVVLHWKADWPATPPFHPEPPSPRRAFPRNPSHASIPAMPQPSAMMSGYHGAQGSFSFSPYSASTAYVPYLTPVGLYPDGSETCTPQIPQQISQDTMVSEGQGGALHSQADHLAKHARDAWFQLSGVKDLPSSVRIYAVITKTISHFQEKFFFPPSLSVFISALNEKSLMKPIKNANGLVCCECTKKFPPRPMKPERPFTFFALLQHFQIVHVTRSRTAAVPDWKTEMIKLPETRVIASLGNAQGMDVEKYRLLQEVFPEAFSSPPLPRASSESRPYTAPKLSCQGLPSEVSSSKDMERGMEAGSHVPGPIETVVAEGRVPCIPEAMAKEGSRLGSDRGGSEVTHRCRNGVIDNRDLSHRREAGHSSSMVLPAANFHISSSNCSQSSRSDDLHSQLQETSHGNESQNTSAVPPTHIVSNNTPTTVLQPLEGPKKEATASSNSKVSKPVVDSSEKTAAERFLDNFLKMTEDLQEPENESNGEAHPHSKEKSHSAAFTPTSSRAREDATAFSVDNGSSARVGTVEDTTLASSQSQHLHNFSRAYQHDLDLSITSSSVNDDFELRRQNVHPFIPKAETTSPASFHAVPERRESRKRSRSPHQEPYRNLGSQRNYNRLCNDIGNRYVKEEHRPRATYPPREPQGIRRDAPYAEYRYRNEPEVKTSRPMSSRPIPPPQSPQRLHPPAAPARQRRYNQPPPHSQAVGQHQSSNGSWNGNGGRGQQIRARNNPYPRRGSYGRGNLNGRGLGGRKKEGHRY